MKQYILYEFAGDKGEQLVFMQFSGYEPEPTEHILGDFDNARELAELMTEQGMISDPSMSLGFAHMIMDDFFED